MPETVDPATGAPLAHYEAHSDEQIASLVASASGATRAWGRAPLEDRVAVLTRLAAELHSGRSEYAGLITAEMGKPAPEASAELEKSAVTAEYYATRGPAILARQNVAVEGASAWVAHEPMGLILAVMPWNFPFWQALRFAIPAILAGNGVLLKHSPNVTGCALAIERAWRRAGLPTGVFTTLVVDEPRVPAVTSRLIADDRVAAVTLTGSNRAGAAVGAAAGRATKKCVLELGGSDAFVVLADADVPAAAAAAVRARFANAGQSCVCAKRFIVERPVFDEFAAAFVDGVRELTIAPLARADLRDVLQRQVDASIAAGATLLTGGKPAPGDGYFYEPTVLSGTGPGMAVFDEETFGPVAALAVAADVADAARLAEATPYGLALSVWTADPARAVALAREVTTGAVFINAVVASDARIPFGGTKRSGHGRELAAAGLLEFTNTRSYWSATSLR